MANHAANAETGPSRLADRFEPVDYETWRERVERELEGAGFESRLVTTTHEGIAVQPLYHPGSQGAARPLRRPPRQASAWTICSLCDDPDPTAAAAAIRDDLAGGAEAIWIELNRGVRLGDPSRASGDGVVLCSITDLERLLEPIDLQRLPVLIDAGAVAASLLAARISSATRRGIATAALAGSAGSDPLGALARDGGLPCSLEVALEQQRELALWTAHDAPRLRAVLVATRAYHDGGATAVQELAYALATGVAYLRNLTRAPEGLSLAAACGQIVFSFGVGRDLFMELCKLRTARALWARVVEACGGSAAAQQSLIHARTARRTKTARDPWVNLLRNTVESFAAVAGRADLISTAPFDEAIGPADPLARRMARNTQLVLQHEARLGQVDDPAAGSFYVESLCHELARRAWALFQQIEASGGMASCIVDGIVARDVAAAREQRRAAVATRRDPVIGVSHYPPPSEAPVQRPARDAAALFREVDDHLVPAGQGPAASAPPVGCWREAEDFEALRDRADALAERPSLLLARFGAPAALRARTEFVRNLLRAGGFAPVAAPQTLDSAAAAVAALAASNAMGAVICATDEAYPALVPELARQLKLAGARAVLVAGRGGEHEADYRAAGVDGFVHLGCDLVSALSATHDLLTAGGGAR